MQNRKTKAKTAPRNPLVLPMLLGRKGGRMKDKRTGRGGAKNKQREYLGDA